jgi:hypothetical protein
MFLKESLVENFKEFPRLQIILIVGLREGVSSLQSVKGLVQIGFARNPCISSILIGDTQITAHQKMCASIFWFSCFFLTSRLFFLMQNAHPVGHPVSVVESRFCAKTVLTIIVKL